MAFSILLLSAVLTLFCAAVRPQEIPTIPKEETYDYIVVGCGIGGLVVSLRISENENVTVICLEAGPFDNYEQSIQIPRFIGDDISSIYDWNITTAPQPQLDGATRPLPLGKVVGGGSVINGMVWNRGNQDDYDAWELLGNVGWGWNDLLPYFKKSETYTPVYYKEAQDQPVTFIPQAHGFGGPVSVSYPKHYWPQSDNWFRALNSLGVATVFDPDEGIAAGGYFLASDINPDNQTRSDARRAYYDPFSSRKNYRVLSDAHVTRLLFKETKQKSLQNRSPETGSRDTPSNSSATSTLRGVSPSPGAREVAGDDDEPLAATGVEYASDPAGPRQTIFARREVILSAGAIHTPQILQLSGIGPAALLNSLSIPVRQDLSGVGSNLQDHCLVHAEYEYQKESLITPYECRDNATFDKEAAAEYRTSKTGPWAAMASNAVAFPSLQQIFPTIPAGTVTNITKFLSEVPMSDIETSHLPPSYDASLRRGYQAQTSNLLPRLSQNTTPAYEILNNNAGRLTVSLMHPLSRGTVEITSLDAFSQPAIDPHWAAHPLDMAILQAGLHFNQAIVSSPPIRDLEPSFDKGMPPPNPTTDFLVDWIKRGIRTEFHSSGTAAMMPRHLGGVVDDKLLVHGTKNVRVVDSSVFPLIPAAHLQAVVYAVAEKAADIIIISDKEHKSA